MPILGHRAILEVCKHMMDDMNCETRVTASCGQCPLIVYEEKCCEHLDAW